MGVLLYYGGHGHSHGGLSNSDDSHSHSPVPETLPILNNSAVHHTARARQVNFKECRFSIIILFRNSSSEVNINVRAAFIHIIGDMIQSIGVLIAALVILYNVS